MAIGLRSFILGSTRRYVLSSVLAYAAVVAAPLPCLAVTYAYVTDSELIKAADRIVRGRVVRVHTEEAPNGALYTVSTISILEDHTGMPGAEVQVRELGGVSASRFLYIPGTVRYEEGREVVVVLKRTRGGHYRSLAMGLSKFDVVPAADGDPVLVRDVRDAAVLGGGVAAVRSTRLSTFREMVRQTRGVASLRRLEADTATRQGERASLLQFDNGLGVRWREADQGIPIRWYRDTTAPAPLISGDGSGEIRLALSAWTTGSQGALNLAYEGDTDQTPYGPWSALGGSGAGVIFFEDPNDEISDYVLAIGGGGGTYNDGGTVNGTVFNRFTHGFVILQNAANLPAAIRQSRDFTRVVQHELGHAIGLGHTPTDRSVADPEYNIMFPSCCTTATPIPPVLGAHDLAVLQFIYPPPSVCSYSLSPAAADVSAAGGPVSTHVNTGSACMWSITGVSSWLAINGAETRSGPGDVSFLVSANTSPQSRTATMTIAGHSYTVTQGATQSAVVPPAIAQDARFNLLWQHEGDGSVAGWVMSGTTQVSGTVLTTVPDTNWKLAGAGDLDGDGQVDFVWQNIVDGRLAAWLLRGQGVLEASALSIPRVEDTGWRIRAVGDLDGDRKADLVWQHADGTLVGWLMDGLQVRRGDTVNAPRVEDTAWRVVAVADFDRDGRGDLLWHHQLNGSVAVWMMNGLTQVAGGPTNPGQVTDVSWKVRAAADLNGDGYPDLVWQNIANGQLAAWLMRELNIIEGGPLSPSQVADTSWRLVGGR
jgi:hypothetical protein